MSNRSSRIGDAGIAGRRAQADLGAELRNARLARGLRLKDLARSLYTSRFHLSRVEQGSLANVGIADLTRHGAALGLRLSARFYPVGGGLRDAAQIDLLRRLRARIGAGARWSWQLEAPIPIPGDLRAFDALLTSRDGAIRVAVEAITRLRDAQAQLREATRKQRDGGATRLVILLKASHHNREALSGAAELLATAFPLSTRATLKALEAGEDPGDNGIALM